MNWVVMDCRSVQTLIIDRRSCFAVVAHKLTMQPHKTSPCGRKMWVLFQFDFKCYEYEKQIEISIL